jgi:hypothetical protein
MTQTAITRQFFPVRNQTMDVVHYALPREEWSRKQIVHRWKQTVRPLAVV